MRYFALVLTLLLLLIPSMVSATPTKDDVCTNPLMYGVEDVGVNTKSIFFSLDLTSGAVTEIGPHRNEYDIEAMDTHPISGLIYGLSGERKQSSSHKKLLIIDPVLGIPLLSSGVQLDIGKNQEYQGASFNPITHELWVGGDNVGIRTVNLNDGSSVVKIKTSKSFETLAWNDAGTKLFGIVGKKLYAINTASGTFNELCSHLPEIEGMEYDLEGNLVIGYHNTDGYNLDILNPNNCHRSHSKTYDLGSYEDIETMTFACGSDDNEVPEFGMFGAALAAIGVLGVAIFKRRL